MYIHTYIHTCSSVITSPTRELSYSLFKVCTSMHDDDDDDDDDDDSVVIIPFFLLPPPRVGRLSVIIIIRDIIILPPLSTPHLSEAG